MEYFHINSKIKVISKKRRKEITYIRNSKIESSKIINKSVKRRHHIAYYLKERN